MKTLLLAIKKVFKKIDAFFLKGRIRRKVKLANKFYKETRYHYLVLYIKGKVVLKPRRTLKKEIKQGLWKKGVTIADIEKRALYKTY